MSKQDLLQEIVQGILLFDEEVDETLALEEYGVDDIDMESIALSIEDAFDVTLEENLPTTLSMEDLRELIEQAS
ncbi:hypothetical protein [Guggenheimella bovis]